MHGRGPTPMEDLKHGHGKEENADGSGYEGEYRMGQKQGNGSYVFADGNEAWYESSFEADQMVAFSRLLAITTGRAFVRVTNSGVSALFGPDGSELARRRGGAATRWFPRPRPRC